MVKDSISKDVAAETLENVSIVSGKTVALLERGVAYIKSQTEGVKSQLQQLTKEQNELAVVSVGVGLLCSGLFGLWFTILVTTGI